MYNKFINPLKVRLLRKQISPEEALRELQAMTDDERYAVQLRACILDELATIDLSSTAKDSAREALRAALRQPSEELRRDATAKILDRIMASPAIKDYHASKRHNERKGGSANRRQKSTPESAPSPGEDETKSTIEVPAVGVSSAESAGPPLRSDSTSDSGRYGERWSAYIAYLNAVTGRRLGRNPLEAGRQEELLDDARAWAEAQLRERASEGSDAVELKNRVVKDTWDRFIPTHRYHSDFKLGYREFASALWEEGLPSLADLAIAAIQERAASAAEGPSSPLRHETTEPAEITDAISDFSSLNRVSQDDPTYEIWKDFYVGLHKSDAQFVSHHARQALERKPLNLNEFFQRAVDLFKTAAEAQISLVTNLESVGACERELKAAMTGALRIFEQFLREFGQEHAAAGTLLSDLRFKLLELMADAKVKALERAEMIEKQASSAEPASDGVPGRAIVDLLLCIVDKRNTTIEDWARSHRFGRTTVFDWKARRLAGRPLKGSVSNKKGIEIEGAIKEDAAELGFTTRTASD